MIDSLKRCLFKNLKPLVPSGLVLLAVTLVPSILSSVSSAARAQEQKTLAERLGYSRAFSRKVATAIEDDHIPFVNAGVSAVDLIDWDYGPNNSYWHTANDTVEHCSPASLTIVGRVVMATLEQLERSLALK